jgi:hypothetical protein
LLAAAVSANFASARQAIDGLRGVLTERMRAAGPPGSLYVIQTLPLASSQASTCSGRSMPLVCLACMSGVPAFGLPKISTSVGRTDMPADAAPAPWSMRPKMLTRLSLRLASRLSIVAFTELWLRMVIKPFSLIPHPRRL